MELCGEGNGTPLQNSCLENPMDGGAVHGVAKSQTWLSDFTFTFHFHALEKEMATHSSVLAWRIPGTEEPGGLPSMGSHRVGHDWSDLAAAAAAGLVKSLYKCILSNMCYWETNCSRQSLSMLKFPWWFSTLRNRALVHCIQFKTISGIGSSVRFQNSGLTWDFFFWPKMNSTNGSVFMSWT